MNMSKAELSLQAGARFGPRAIRHASSRQTAYRGFNPRANISPYENWAGIVDCGDVPVAPFGSGIARGQIVDHSRSLPALRAWKVIHGKPERVIHFNGGYFKDCCRCIC
ncbi:hypothetical protein HDV64DRAFT_21643 [Trichoderma sp. TUCIM 5745]